MARKIKPMVSTTGERRRVASCRPDSRRLRPVDGNSSPRGPSAHPRHPCRSPNATPDEIIRILERRYLAAVTTGGAAVGATAVIPGVGTGVTLALSGFETAAFPRGDRPVHPVGERGPRIAVNGPRAGRAHSS